VVAPGAAEQRSEFTVASIAVYHLHDVVHHAWDVDPGRDSGEQEQRA
jgi:hypothetical protein